MYKLKINSKKIKAMQTSQPQFEEGIEEMISSYLVTIPTEITVHLGAPDEEAENVTIPFLDYIKNAASSELYPTWPEAALRANIHAITSTALNRIYTEWYRSRGYNFDITNSTKYDQAFVPRIGIYEPIDVIANEIFNQYIVRVGQVQPLFSTFCDGRVINCEGMSQWGTVELANQGYTPMEILKYYFGDDIGIVAGVPVGDVATSYPGEPLKLGDSSIDVLRMQLYLDRIRVNYPGIPQIQEIIGYFDESTEQAVRAFQSAFNLPVTGIVDQGTWYLIRRIYIAVTKLAELTSQGVILSRIIGIVDEASLEGDIRPRVEFIQYALNVLAAYYPTIVGVPITGVFDEQTRQQVIEFQRTMGLEPTGVVDSETLGALSSSLFGILDTLPPEAIFLPSFRWPGVVYELGRTSPGIYILQEMLSYISLTISAIPVVDPNGVFDEATLSAVKAFQEILGIEPTGLVDEKTWNSIVDIYRQQRFGSVTTPQLQGAVL